MKNSQKYSLDQISEMFTKSEIKKTVESLDEDGSGFSHMSKDELIDYLFFDLDGLDEHYDIIEEIRQANSK